MKKAIILSAFIVAVLCLSGCASIVSGTKTTVTITTNAPNATVKVRRTLDKSVVSSGKVPFTTKLRTTRNVMTPERYYVEVFDEKKKKRSITIETDFNPWFLGNFIFGWLPGFAIDIITGSCYRFDNEIYVNFPEHDVND